MNDLIDIRTPLAASKNTRVELGRDGVLHVLVGPVTVHLDRATCEELATTLARSMVTLATLHPKTRPPALVLIENEGSDKAEANAEVRAFPARLR